MSTTLTSSYVCDGCDAAMGGYSWTDLLKVGWRRHLLKGAREFVLCEACQARADGKGRPAT